MQKVHRHGLAARVVIVSILIMLTGFTLPAAFAQESGKPTLSAVDKDYVVKLGYYNCDHMTAAPIAKDAGIFEELGLKVEVTGNGQVPQAMAAGQMDVGYIGVERMVRAQVKGSPIFIAAQNHLGGSMYIVVRQGINNPKELVGKKLAIHKSGSTPEKFSGEWLRFATSSGIPVEGKNYELFDMADKDQFLALKLGKLDGYLTCDPWGSMAEHDGCGRIMYAATKMPSGKWGTCCVYSMNSNFASAHPELAKKMILAHARAIQLIYTRPLKAAEIFEKNYSVPLEVGLMTIYKKTVEEDRTLTWDLRMENIREALDWDVKNGILEEMGKPDEYVRTDLLTQSGADNFDKFIKEKVDPVFPVSMAYADWKKKAYAIEGKTPPAAP